MRGAAAWRMPWAFTECPPLFVLALQELISSKDADHSARWLAAVQLKNSVNKYWRSRLPG